MVGLAAALVAPSANALWYAHGSYEPDTQADIDSGLMYTTPDSEADGKKVYFSAYAHPFVSSVNPNVAAAGSSIRSTPTMTFSAFFGVWKDCNKDDYIGYNEAFAEYPSVLLSDTSVCPDGGDFNKGGWVTEFLWIGPKDMVDDCSPTCEADNANFGFRRLLNDTEARVWGDGGLADGAAPGGSCTINPPPAGTTARSGAAIGYVDCLQRGRVTETINALDPECDLNICFVGDDRDTPGGSDSALNVVYPVNPWYDPYAPEGERTGALDVNDDAQDDAFSVWDCDATTEEDVMDPTGEMPQNVTVPEVATVTLTDPEGRITTVSVPTASPQPGAPDGSVADGANGALAVCDIPPVTPGLGSTNPEGGGGVNANKGRRQSDVYFAFDHPTELLNVGAFSGCILTIAANETRGTPEVPLPVGCREPGYVGGTVFNPEAPWDGGLALHRGGIFGGPNWYGYPNYLYEPQVVNIDTFAPEARTYWTFYAYFSDQLESLELQTPTTTPETYGAPWCGTATSGIVNGWDCDADNWWNQTYDPQVDAMPTETPYGGDGETRDIGVKVGQSYWLRDTDCYDGEVAMNSGIYASLVTAATGPCARPQ